MGPHSVNPTALGSPNHPLQPQRFFISSPSSMLMSSPVHSLDLSLFCIGPEKKGKRSEREPKLPSFFSHPGLLLCAVQLAMTPDPRPLLLTPGPVPTPRLFVSTSPWQHLGHCCCHGNRWTGAWK
ncbi:hypothetical protein WMY93_020175 [Mugilogobius chulae]|uniref:Uncharacterized protein n=1 Tax=Mugilogobius chulae TaxID=88201 RepID=A0AAW0NRA0_9GOBI